MAIEGGWSELSNMVKKYGGILRRPVVNGLIREGEIMNIVAPSKVGKSWLVYNLALAVASGTHFIQHAWDCGRPGQVAIIDNELHKETLAFRIPKVRKAMELDPSFENNIKICALRGKVQSISNLYPLIESAAKGFMPKLLIIDSLYRSLGDGFSENDNSMITSVYNMLDMYAHMLNRCAIVIIHHSTKGPQGSKSVTDVGSGAGAQSRAADTHFIIREVGDLRYRADARCRSFAQPGSLKLEWCFPLWKEA